MAARKGIKAKVIERLKQAPMTGREIERTYIEFGGALDTREGRSGKRVSYDTMQRLLRSLPATVSDAQMNSRSPLLDRTYTFEPVPPSEFARGQTVYLMDCVSWDPRRQGVITEGRVVRYCGGTENVQYYNVSHPEYGQVGVERWKGRDYPTNVFASWQEAKDLYDLVLSRNAATAVE